MLTFFRCYKVITITEDYNVYFMCAMHAVAYSVFGFTIAVTCYVLHVRSKLVFRHHKPTAAKSADEKANRQRASERRECLQWERI